MHKKKCGAESCMLKLLAGIPRTISLTSMVTWKNGKRLSESDDRMRTGTGPILQQLKMDRFRTHHRTHNCEHMDAVYLRIHQPSIFLRYTLEEFEEEYSGLEQWIQAKRDPGVESDSSHYYSTTEEEFEVDADECG